MRKALFIGGSADGEYLRMNEGGLEASALGSNDSYYGHVLQGADQQFQLAVFSELHLDDALARLLEHYRPK